MWVMAQVPPCEAVTPSKAILFQRTVFSLGTFRCSARTGWGFSWSFRMCCDILQGSRGDKQQSGGPPGEAGVPPGSFGSLGRLGPTAHSGPQVQGVPTGPGAAGQRDPVETVVPLTGVPATVAWRTGRVGAGRPHDSCIVWH